MIKNPMTTPKEQADILMTGGESRVEDEREHVEIIANENRYEKEMKNTNVFEDPIMTEI